MNICSYVHYTRNASAVNHKKPLKKTPKKHKKDTFRFYTHKHQKQVMLQEAKDVR